MTNLPSRGCHQLCLLLYEEMARYYKKFKMDFVPPIFPMNNVMANITVTVSCGSFNFIRVHCYPIWGLPWSKLRRNFIYSSVQLFNLISQYFPCFLQIKQSKICVPLKVYPHLKPTSCSMKNKCNIRASSQDQTLA